MVGRPLKYETVEELEEAIDKYFAEKCTDEPFLDAEDKIMVDSKGKRVFKVNPPTVAGLALYLGFSDRSSMYNYKDRKEFSHTIKKAITRIEEYAEKQLTIGQSVGAIFWLKNHGWIDKSTKELTGANGESLVQKVFVTKEQEEAVEEHINDVIGTSG